MLKLSQMLITKYNNSINVDGTITANGNNWLPGNLVEMALDHMIHLPHPTTKFGHNK
jgi:hypothetical protein